MITATLAKSYTPADTEHEIRARWDTDRAFHAGPDEPGEPYSILIPPPNVTAALHLGHAFNNTLQDVLIRHHRMRGFNTLWMPGTDHAGIATQTVVEKRLLAEEGRKRTDFERDEFVQRVQSWKDEYEATITEQLKAMGCSCDWDRQRFTMDPMCAAAVREAFFRLFRDELIYRGKRLVNWDPVSQTALADDEVEMQEVEGSFWYLRYLLEHVDGSPVTWSELAARGYPVALGGEFGEDVHAWVTVATTRPETYLGDTAVAVNPADRRAAALSGLRARLPLVGRTIPIIEDEYVVLPDESSSDPKARYATGFLKVTPAHDPNDWDIGRRHDLDVINVMAPDATISDRHGWDDIGDAGLFVGLSREDAHRKVVKEFEARSLLETVKPYAHSVGHSYRSHVPIEPYLSDQWYVRVTDDRLVGEAQRAIVDEQYDGAKPARATGAHDGDGNLRFFPARYAKMYQAWHDNLRDWCISRQLWWGHRIPVWSCRFDDLAKGDEVFRRWHATAEADVDRIALRHVETPDGVELQLCFGREDDTTDELIRRAESDGFERDPDVLDTWFSSALWPLNTMGWPDPSAFDGTAGLLEKFNPTSVLCTGRDIITLWVSHMVMFNRHFNGGNVPFRHVYINPMIQDGYGQRMSKSLGNGVDPRDIIHSHGADALRYSLVLMATSTQDCRMPVDMVCPHCAETFHPQEITSPAGYRVAGPTPTCPKCGKSMTSGYGAASGAARPTDEAPLARNTSAKFDRGRNFANKLWNATRFALHNLEGGGRGTTSPGDWTLVDRWIITRLHRTLHAVEDALADYQFSAYAEAMDDFVWRDFCDWYLEAIKPTVRSSPAQQQVLRTVLDATLRLLHPICPFITETLWPHVCATGAAGLDGIRLAPAELLATATWPDIRCSIDDDDAATTFERVQTLVGAIRLIRAEKNVPVKHRITLHANDDARALIDAAGEIVQTLAGLETVADLDDRPGHVIPLAFEGGELFLSNMVDDVDVDAERERLGRLIEEMEGKARNLRGRLSNEAYVSKAPARLVDETRGQLTQTEADLDAARRALESLARAE